MGGSGIGAGGDNRKRARSAQRRVGPKARPTAGAPATGPCVSAGFPFVRALSPPCAFLRVATFCASNVATVATFN